MTKEEALEKANLEMRELINPTDPEDSPMWWMQEDLAGAARGLKTGNVPKALERGHALVKALAVPMRYSWTELSDEQERDPVSGKMRPKLKRCTENLPCAEDLVGIRNAFLDLVRALAAYAKKIASPAYDELRAVCIELELNEERRQKMTTPLDGDFAEDAVNRISRAMFELWVDSRIDAAGKEA